MPPITILTATLAKVRLILPELQPNQTYLSPNIVPYQIQQRIEVQVAEGDIRYGDQSGSVRPEDFIIVIGILMRSAKDVNDKFSRTLADEAHGIHALKQRIVDGLNLHFLRDEDDLMLLTRPLVVQSERAVYSPKDSPGILVKEIYFSGGINV